MDFTGRPAQLILIASVARRSYQGKSKIEIAEELGLSRFKVARLLETARQVPPASATRWRNNAWGIAFACSCRCQWLPDAGRGRWHWKEMLLLEPCPQG